MKIFSFILLFLFPYIIVAQVNIYVDASKATSGNGSSWSQAYKDLNEAIKFANEGTGKFDIHVAKGTYHPSHATQDGNPYSGLTSHKTGQFKWRACWRTGCFWVWNDRYHGYN